MRIRRAALISFLRAAPPGWGWGSRGLAEGAGGHQASGEGPYWVLQVTPAGRKGGLLVSEAQRRAIGVYTGQQAEEAAGGGGGGSRIAPPFKKVKGPHMASLTLVAGSMSFTSAAMITNPYLQEGGGGEGGSGACCVRRGAAEERATLGLGLWGRGTGDGAGGSAQHRTPPRGV